MLSESGHILLCIGQNASSLLMFDSEDHCYQNETLVLAFDGLEELSGIGLRISPTLLRDTHHHRIEVKSSLPHDLRFNLLLSHLRNVYHKSDFWLPIVGVSKLHGKFIYGATY